MPTVVLVSALWPNSTSNTAVQSAALDVGQRIDALASSQNRLRRFRYLNYAHPGQNPLRSYGADNFAELVEASRQYDPKGVFQKLVPGGFKLM